MRFVHIDEAGTSKNENICVVAGVMSNADEQWVSLNCYLADLVEEFVPESERTGFIFHAKDIWHGSGKIHRDRWSRVKRIALLTELAKAPSRFELPVVSGVVDKREHDWGVNCKPGSQTWEAHAYSLAFGLSAVHAEYVLQKFYPKEVATIIAEDAPPMRRYAQHGFKILSDPRHSWPGLMDIVNYMPITQIVEQPLFAAKNESSILQISDCLAFIIGRIMNEKPDVMPLFKLFQDHLVILPHQR